MPAHEQDDKHDDHDDHDDSEADKHGLLLSFICGSHNGEPGWRAGARAALGTIFLAILIAGCVSRAHPGGASALAGTSAAVREALVTIGITVLPFRCCRPTVNFAVDLQ